MHWQGWESKQRRIQVKFHTKFSFIPYGYWKASLCLVKTRLVIRSDIKGRFARVYKSVSVSGAVPIPSRKQPLILFLDIWRPWAIKCDAVPVDGLVAEQQWFLSSRTWEKACFSHLTKTCTRAHKRSSGFEFARAPSCKSSLFAVLWVGRRGSFTRKIERWLAGKTWPFDATPLWQLEVRKTVAAGERGRRRGASLDAKTPAWLHWLIGFNINTSINGFARWLFSQQGRFFFLSEPIVLSCYYKRKTLLHLAD